MTIRLIIFETKILSFNNLKDYYNCIILNKDSYAQEAYIKDNTIHLINKINSQFHNILSRTTVTKLLNEYYPDFSICGTESYDFQILISNNKEIEIINYISQLHDDFTFLGTITHSTKEIKIFKTINKIKELCLKKYPEYKISGD